jgi:hypothetical protein
MKSDGFEKLKNLLESDKKMSNADFISQLNRILDEQEELPIDSSDDDEPIGVEKFLEQAEIAEKIKEELEKRLKVSKKREKREKMEEMEKRIEAARLAVMEEASKKRLAISGETEKLIVCTKNYFYTFYSGKGKRVLTKYFNILNCVEIYNDRPDKPTMEWLSGPIDNMTFKPIDRMVIKRLLFIKTIMRNNIEPTKRKLFSACVVINILWEAIMYARDVARESEVSTFSAKHIFFDDLKFLLDYFDDYFDDGEFDSQKKLIVPRPYKSFIRNLYLSVHGTGEQQAEAKKALDLALENKDVFEARN